MSLDNLVLGDAGLSLQAVDVLCEDLEEQTFVC